MLWSQMNEAESSFAIACLSTRREVELVLMGSLAMHIAPIGQRHHSYASEC